MHESFQSLTWKRVSVFIALYLALSYFALSFITEPGQVTLLWPAAGLAMAFGLRYGLAWCIPVAVSVFLFHSLFNRQPGAFMVISILANVFGVFSAVLYVRKRKTGRMLSMQGGFALVQGALLMSIVTAVIGVSGMYLINEIDAEGFQASFVKWALGDLLGIICIAPAVLVALSSVSQEQDSPLESDYAGARSRVVWSALLTLSLLVIFVSGFSKSAYVLGLSPIPVALVVWSAIRLPPIWTTVGNAMAVLAIACMIGLGLSGFQPPQNYHDRVFLLVFLCLMAIFPLILMASNHENRKSIRKLFRRATTDNDTGLPNRTAFEEASTELLNGGGSVTTLAYLDFDHFTLVNDTVSHAAGDALISSIASLLQANMRSGERLFRIGGDEFAMLLPANGKAAERRAQQFISSIETFRIGWDGHVLSTTASIGLAELTPGASGFAQALSQADAACFTAKELGGNRICLADEHTEVMMVHTEAMQWAVRIRSALANSGFEIHCQEIGAFKASADGGREFEVLLRLRDPDTGKLLSPSLFMPAAERFDLGTRIDRHVIELLLAWMESHPDEAKTVSSCSINLSAGTMQDESFADFLNRRLGASMFPAEKIVFEITETSALLDLAHAQALIARLRQIGCRFALDDFGTGFCSFQYLQNLDVDTFKIDGSFVRDLETSQLSRAVIRSITEIAHVLDKSTTAEHCESREIIDLLRELGVDRVQGFAIHKPEPIAAYFSREALMIDR